jgi:hypothetical protein
MKAQLRSLIIAVTCLCSLPARANYWDFHDLVPNQTWQIESQVNVIPNNTYFATVCLSSASGYGGMQQATPTDRRGLFSIWDSSNAVIDSYVQGLNPHLTWLGPTNHRFGNEGAGAQLLFRWNWQTGKPYRMAWRRFVVPGSTMVTYEGWFHDPHNAAFGGWIFAGSIQRPQTTHYASNMNVFEGFSEDWYGTGGVRDITLRNVWLLDLNNTWRNITRAYMNDPRDRARLYAVPGGWRHRSYDPALTYQGVASLAMQPDATLAPLPLPYFINCGQVARNNYVKTNQVASTVQRAFAPDAFWFGTSAAVTTATAVTTTGILKAAPAKLYNSRREGTGFGYRCFGLKAHTQHLVRLHFSEPRFNTIGSARQSITINNVIVHPGLDIRAIAGAANRALVLDYFATPGADGLITISLASTIAGVPAIISGVEVTPVR